jgi:hypothetical protein
MTRLFQRCWWILLLAAGAQSASAFSFWGTKEAFQTDAFGYDRLTEIEYPATHWNLIDPEISYAPHNLGEEFRWNIPVLYYTYDPSFLNYFGTVGATQVDGAFAILNNLKNVSDYSTNLTEVPLEELRYNYTAMAFHLFDLKSAALEMVLTRLGPADPEHWMFCIQNRILPPGKACPAFDYTVIQRNFDPDTLAPSKYVNGKLFTYHWLQFCGVFADRGDPVEFPVDPLTPEFGAVASPKVTIPNIAYYGMFHTGLTRDDVASLRYLYATNNMNVEQSSPDSTFFQTNTTSQLFVGSNLTLFAAQALTNNAATLSALFPGLVITATTNTFTNVYTTNLTAYFTNFPWDPFGTPAHVAFATNVTVAVQTLFSHTFANAMQIQQVPGGWVTVPMTQLPAPGLAFATTVTNIIVVTNFPWAPPGTTTIATNTTGKTYLTNVVSGEFFIVSTNFCDAAIIAVQLTNVIRNTNITISLTNTAPNTNVSGTILSFQQAQVNYFTNHTFVIYPVSCVSNSVALRQGLEKISFVRHDFDSLLSRFFLPVTNNYSMTAVTNGQAMVQKFQRIVTTPDILLTAADLPQNLLPIDTVEHIGSYPTLNASNAIPGLAGPGTFLGPMTLTFNNVGPIRLNSGPSWLQESSGNLYFNWASFDGSTNAPYLYPQGASITDLENQVLVQVSPSSLPAGVAGINYSATLSVAGGQAPYSWALGPSSPALPPGLNLTQNPNDSSQATISGTPLVQGTFTFWVRMTDARGVFVDQFYAFQVN